MIMQSLPQQLPRKPEGNETLLAHQAGLQGAFGSNNFPSPSAVQLPQQSRKFIELAQHGSCQEAQLKPQGVEQQMPNPVHQAYLQYAFQAAQQKSALAMQSQPQPKMGMLGPSSVKDQEMRMGNLKIQDLMSMQAANQAQGSISRNVPEQFSHGEKQIEQGQKLAPDQKGEGKPSIQGPAMRQLMPGNMIRPVQAPATWQGIQNVVNNQIAVPAQLQAVQAWAREHNIDLSHPANANLMAQLIPMMQSRMVSQQKENESGNGVQSSVVPVSKQQVTSPAGASDSSAHAYSSSDASGLSSSAKPRQTLAASQFGLPTNAVAASNSGDIAVHQFNNPGKESQISLRQPFVVGNGMPSVHPEHTSTNMNLGADHPLNAKNTLSGPEHLQMQYIRKLNQSSPQASGPTNEGGLGNYVKSQGAPSQMPQQQHGFTKQQLHVLKAQILAFRRLKVKLCYLSHSRLHLSALCVHVLCIYSW